jgi:multiple sugar transport system permease protein
MTFREGTASRVLTDLALVGVAIFFGAPVVWVLMQAFDAGESGALLKPAELTLRHFREVLDQEQTRTALTNSVIVAGSCTVAGTLLAALAGFALSRLRVRRKNELVYGVLLLYAIPLTVTMVAIYELAIRLDFANTFRGLIVAQTAIMLPFLSWLMKGFYDRVPESLDEAAWLDGRSSLRAWWEILTPVALPGIAITAGLAFVTAWSEVLLPIVLISDPALTTLARLVFDSAETSTSYATTAALGAIYFAPVLLVFLLLRGLMLRSIRERRGSAP